MEVPRNQSIYSLCKSVDWFLFDMGLRHERIKRLVCNDLQVMSEVTHA